MEIHEQRKGAVTVLMPDGPLIGDDADTFRERAIMIFGRSLGRVVVDASKLAFVDSKGIEALVDVNEHISQSGQALKLCNTNKTICEVLSLTEMTSLFEQYEDVNAAVRSFL